jgi:lysine-N-methylase
VKPVKRLQPRSYQAFRCIGAECEDTCCVGWIVSVDQKTYEAYQRCEDPELGSPLHNLVAINPQNGSGDNYARIALSGSGCPFLAEGLCSIQKKLGEEYLPIMCASYPRVMNMVDDVLERSLDLSCPEAARLVILDPGRMEFDEDGSHQDARLANLSFLDTAGASVDKPFRHFQEIRRLIVWLLEDRSLSLWKRLVILGSLCDQLHTSACAGRSSETPGVLEGYRDATERGLFDQALASHCARPAAQLEVVLELIIARISAEITPPRFLECYQDFMTSVEWTANSSMADIGRRYAAAHSEFYAPFMSAHEYILEHYLLNYVHRTLFPLGPQSSSRNLSMSNIATSIRDQCLLLFAYFAIVQTLMIGAAGVHGAKLDASHVVKVIQTSAKTFEHSLDFPLRALQILAKHGIENCAGLAILLKT